ncbi:MAG: ATP-binding protein [Candidatus Hydrogenedentes bacterium]|nr:ATP-binding protein [Candidatus Hydrogenedentota bacterium]
MRNTVNSSEVTKFSWVKDETTREYLKAIYRVQHFYSTITDLDQLLVLITEECKNACEAESASLLLYDEKRKCLSFQVTLGPVGSDIIKKEIRISEGTGIAGEVALTKKPKIVNDVSKEPKFYKGVDEITRYKTKNILAVPIIHNKKLIGVIEVVNKKNNHFSHEDLRFLEIIASWAGSAVVTSKLIQEKIQVEKLATIGYTLTALAHQLKNVLTAMVTSVELIEKSLEKKQFQTIEKAWPVLKRTSIYILEFVQDLLLFSKPRIPQKKQCNFYDITTKLKEIFNDLFSTRGIKLYIDTSQVKEPVFLDPNGIFHCLTNLLINAGESAPQKTGEVRIIAETKKQNLLVITVSDNGSGIPQEELPYIFDPFHSSKGYKGTGLGLAVTKKIVEEHNGTIEVKNIPNGGAQFIIHLPQKNEKS